jgi:uncharacterized SAM-binding protein YcdF (DUF218 family)
VFGLAFRLFSVLVIVIIVAIIAVIAYTLVKGLSQRRSDNASPVLTVDARVVAKRLEVRGHQAGTGVIGANGAIGGTAHTTTRYYTTFELDHGSRLELAVDPQTYAMLTEGDAGQLTFQGTRFKDFSRQLGWTQPPDLR